MYSVIFVHICICPCISPFKYNVRAVHANSVLCSVDYSLSATVRQLQFVGNCQSTTVCRQLSVVYSVSSTVSRLQCVVNCQSTTVCRQLSVVYSVSATVSRLQCAGNCQSSTVCRQLSVVYSAPATVSRLQCAGNCQSSTVRRQLSVVWAKAFKEQPVTAASFIKLCTHNYATTLLSSGSI